MQGIYSAPLVALSLVIAALASFVALEFAGRLFERRDEATARWLGWLAGGAFAMGSGIWSMHFVGMAAFSLPVAISYDLALTVVSWLAAVAVSALALFIVARRTLSAATVALGAVAMGAGICVMHYLGMGAMRMNPGIGYDPVWFGLSVLIAVGASAAALLIVSALRLVRTWRDVALRAGASLVMGLAVAGMHYSGMAAARFDADAFCASGNLLRGDWLATPIAVASVLGLGLALVFTVKDARAILRARREARALAERVTTLAFTDRETGLANRPRLSQLVTDALTAGVAPLCLLSLRLRALDGATRADVPAAAGALLSALPAGWTLARTSPDQFMVLVAHARAVDVAIRAQAAWASVVSRLHARGMALQFGLAESPRDGHTAQMLLFRASARAVPLEFLLASAAGERALDAVA